MATPHIKPGKHASRSWRQRHTVFGTANPYRESTDKTMVNDLANAQAAASRSGDRFEFVTDRPLSRKDKKILKSIRYNAKRDQTD